MGHLKGTNREQCGLWVLEDMVDGESMARVIDRYIEVLNLRQLGFTRTIPADTGRPAYLRKTITINILGFGWFSNKDKYHLPLYILLSNV